MKKLIFESSTKIEGGTSIHGKPSGEVIKNDYFRLWQLLSGVWLVLVLLSSCAPEETLVPDDNPNVSQHSGRAMTLGKKLENPYSIKNMRIAYNNMKSKNNGGRVLENIDIYATHYYVRFLPANYTLYDSLEQDSTLYLFDHPLDYDIEEDGDFYHDPSIPDSLPTYQYTAVPVGYHAPEGIEVEILEELYLPREDSLLKDAGGRIAAENEEFIDHLEYEALSLTGNLDESETLANGRTNGLLPSKYHPQGSVKFRDTRLGIINMEGVKIRTRRWFEVHEAITDANGNFYVDGTYRYKFDYNIIWERHTFDVRSGTLGQATMDGPNRKGDWHVTVDGGEQAFYASVFRGAHRYFYKDIGGLKRPKLWSKLKLCAYDKNNNGTNGDNWGNWDFKGVFPDIRIWSTVNGRRRGTDEIFSTTVHEIAHASHIALMNGGDIQYNQVSNTIVESWAVAVQWQITAMEYREKGIADYAGPLFNNTRIDRLQFAFQWWNANMDNAYPYTSLFIDLVDDYNQAGITYLVNGQTIGIVDNVSGYSLSMIESRILKHTYGISSLRSKLRSNKISNVTDAQIDELLNQF